MYEVESILLTDINEQLQVFATGARILVKFGGDIFSASISLQEDDTPIKVIKKGTFIRLYFLHVKSIEKYLYPDSTFTIITPIEKIGEGQILVVKPNFRPHTQFQ
ncbi:MAG: hypothetical protein R2795_15155 [Saprospiraceae bacterium]